MNRETGEGTLFLLNKSYGENTVFEVKLPFDNVIIDCVTELWSEDYSKVNTMAEPEAVKPVTMENLSMTTNGSFTVTAKPVSILQINFKVQ